MGTTTQSGSRAWEPDPDETVAISASEAGQLPLDETAAADQAALAAFAEAWSRGPVPDDPESAELDATVPREDTTPDQPRARSAAQAHGLPP